MPPTPGRILIATAVLLAAGVATALGQADDAVLDEDTPEAAATEEASGGILPVPDYGGDLSERSALTGDWGGGRGGLAERGVQLELNWIQYVQGIASGGQSRTTRYGGKGEYVLNFDLDRMELVPGGVVTVRAESRYGNSVNGKVGTILPVNTPAFFPVTDDLDEDVPFAITTLLYTQYLSEQFGIFLGKLDTLDGDSNEFASGRGATQFMNANFVFNSALALRLPYSTLGVGAAWFPSDRFSLTANVFNTVDSSTTTGFSDFGDGTSATVEAKWQYRLGDLPGGVTAGGLYSFNQDFRKIGARIILDPGQGLVVPTQNHTWAVFLNGWQYLWADGPAEGAIAVGDGRPDLRGIGVFARFGFADRDTNPIEWTGSIGLGGRGLIPTRQDDSFGVGWFYNSIQQTDFTGIVGIDDNSQGLEAYYDLAITPAANLTFDLQIIEGAVPNVDTAVVLGARLRLAF